MAIRPDYTEGTITLTTGLSTVSGTGMLFESTADVRAGDMLIDIPGAGGNQAVILSVGGESSLTLTKPWEGPSLANVAYRLRFQPDGSRYTAVSVELLDKLSRGPALVGNWDAVADDLIERAAFDGEAAGFRVAVSDAGSGRSAVYQKKSASSGDWSAPLWLTGAPGGDGSDGVQSSDSSISDIRAMPKSAYDLLPPDATTIYYTWTD